MNVKPNSCLVPYLGVGDMIAHFLALVDGRSSLFLVLLGEGVRHNRRNKLRATAVVKNQYQPFLISMD
jgi:hypothetical protein